MLVKLLLLYAMMPSLYWRFVLPDRMIWKVLAFELAETIASFELLV